MLFPNINWLFKVDDNLLILPFVCILKNSTSLRDTHNIYIRLNSKLEFINLEEDLNKKKLLVDLDAFKAFLVLESANNYHPNRISKFFI